MGLIDKVLSIWLKDRGIKSYDELTEKEKKIYEERKKELEEGLGEITIPKLEELINDLRQALKKELLNYENPKEKDLFLKARLKNLEDLIDLIHLPETRKQNLENQIKRSGE